jgi:hypothetical protein
MPTPTHTRRLNRSATLNDPSFTSQHSIYQNRLRPQYISTTHRTATSRRPHWHPSTQKNTRSSTGIGAMSHATAAWQRQASRCSRLPTRRCGACHPRPGGTSAYIGRMSRAGEACGESPRFGVQGIASTRRTSGTDRMLDGGPLMDLDQDRSMGTHESSYYAKAFLEGTTHGTASTSPFPSDSKTGPHTYINRQHPRRCRHSITEARHG